jgi:hypothetical protein
MNPAPACFVVQGQDGERPLTCDSRMPAVTAGARREPAGPGAVRTQHGPAFLRNGRRPIRSHGAAVSALAIQLALIVPLKAPAMQVKLAANPMEPVLEPGHWPAPSGSAGLSARQCASSQELSPGQVRRGTRSAPGHSRGGGAAAGDLVVVSDRTVAYRAAKTARELLDRCP